jgi:hypothetical protein
MGLEPWREDSKQSIHAEGTTLKRLRVDDFKSPCKSTWGALVKGAPQ